MLSENLLFKSFKILGPVSLCEAPGTRVKTVVAAAQTHQQVLGFCLRVMLAGRVLTVLPLDAGADATELQGWKGSDHYIHLQWHLSGQSQQSQASAGVMAEATVAATPWASPSTSDWASRLDGACCVFPLQTPQHSKPLNTCNKVILSTQEKKENNLYEMMKSRQFELR